MGKALVSVDGKNPPASYRGVEISIKVDWWSFTLPNHLEPITANDLIKIARIKLDERYKKLGEAVMGNQTFDRVPGRAPFRLCVANGDRTVRIFGGGRAGETILYELSGRGCDRLGSIDNARTYIGGFVERTSRLDIACDMDSPTRPITFTDKRNPTHFKSKSVIESKSGETVYIGSPKSHRYCRVYRYNHPHPRHKLLRAEFVFRKRLARAAARDFVETKETDRYVAELGNTFGFAHPDWQPKSTTMSKLSVPHVSRKDEDTIAWVYASVVPALKRLVKDGAIDMAEFLSAEFGITVIETKSP